MNTDNINISFTSSFLNLSSICILWSDVGYPVAKAAAVGAIHFVQLQKSKIRVLLLPVDSLPLGGFSSSITFPFFAYVPYEPQVCHLTPIGQPKS